MKVYGNVDTKDVASFVFFVAEDDDNVVRLFNDSACTEATSLKDLSDVVAKAPIFLKAVSDSTTTFTPAGVVTLTGVYGSIVFGASTAYTKEYTAD